MSRFMKVMRVTIALLACTAGACSRGAPSSKPATLGTVTSELSELAKTRCDEGAMIYEPKDKALELLEPVTRSRLERTRIVGLRCDPPGTVEMVLGTDDQSLYSLLLVDVTDDVATQWFSALARAGLNAEVVRDAEAAIAGNMPAPGTVRDIKSRDGSIRVLATVRPGGYSWNIDIAILK